MFHQQIFQTNKLDISTANSGDRRHVWQVYSSPAESWVELFSYFDLVCQVLKACRMGYPEECLQLFSKEPNNCPALSPPPPLFFFFLILRPVSSSQKCHCPKNPANWMLGNSAVKMSAVVMRHVLTQWRLVSNGPVRPLGLHGWNTMLFTQILCLGCQCWPNSFLIFVSGWL